MLLSTGQEGMTNDKEASPACREVLAIIKAAFKAWGEALAIAGKEMQTRNSDSERSLALAQELLALSGMIFSLPCALHSPFPIPLRVQSGHWKLALCLCIQLVAYGTTPYTQKRQAILEKKCI